MKVKTKLGNIMGLYSSKFFQELHQVKSKDVYASYRVRKILHSIVSAGEQINKGRSEIFTKYGVKIKDESGHETGDIKVRTPFVERMIHPSLPEAEKEKIKKQLDKEREEWNAFSEEEKAQIKTNFEAFSKETNEYFDKEDIFDICYLLDIKDFEKMGVDVSPSDLILLDPILDRKKIDKYLAEMDKEEAQEDNK
jgi:hypothetical protein